MTSVIKKEYKLRLESPIFLSVDPTLSKLLYHRGINSIESAEVFLSPDYDNHQNDPFLMKGMTKAVKRVLEAIEKKEKIVIYSDYDADGIPGGVMMREFFDRVGYSNVENYIPHRHDEGFGLNSSAIEEFGKGGVKLLITIDCGIADADAVAGANKLGIDVIITDHHEPNGKIPKAFAILDPKQDGCNYPDKNLCGTGVAFKFIQGILQKKRFGLAEGKEKWFLDLVGIATLSDMVPLVGENRVFSHYGLKVLQKSSRPGLSKLWSKLGVDQRYITEDDIGFTLAPRINAASRMGEPMDAFRLLATKDFTEADLVSNHLNQINNERKGVVASIVKDIKKNLRNRLTNNTLRNIIVVGNPDWRPALLGLAANSIAEEFGRPVFIWGRNGDQTLKGSCRSDGTTNLMALMEAVKDSFLQFGGHKMAGGFSVSNERIHTLEDDLNKIKLPKSDTDGNWIDSSLDLDDLQGVYFQISRLAPFGVGNEKPKFMFKNVVPIEVKQFGKEKNHLELSFENSIREKVRALSFFSKPESFSIPPERGKSINLIATLEKSFFGKKPELRLRVVDIA